MCNFKSAIVMRDESVKGGFKLLMSPWTESHSELETIFKLREGARLNYAKVEFTPESMGNAHKVETYKLRIDQDRVPEWFDSEMKEKVTKKLSDYIKSIIVTGDVQLLIGGQFIIAPGAKVECAKAMVINSICGGTVSAICGGTVSEIRGGTVSEIWGGTVSEIRGGTVSAICGGTVSEIWGGTVSEIRGGTVSEIWGGTVSEIWGGTVSAIWGGTVSEIWGGTVSEIRGGTVSAIWGGTVSEIRGGTVSEIRGGTVSEIRKHFSGIIGKIYKGAKIENDNRDKK